ncbi:TetR/AcrR family transcriptional regulator [Streptomyces sp. CB01881]|uniref:TetR/AcrR family transcriptional regulator n=1 Tax=Streptomyces sp. CB01881 TaxID=2078691 RepID=UPI000CDC476F|nr:TetR/AcrR family transcriptional regulator [Streptomyces sp. CB01881]AUY54286.1 TetR family transcriptional regulator [Streptomyces sp. CB01881]TYC73778.1 TetR/AcrR family transcriptional regulator [Streptomyces sp. CB01881]
MGNREDLLAGAKKCLHERGYARTTARDIVAASGANLASIGYHFGSKEALLSEAVIESFEEWGTELRRILDEATDPSIDTAWRSVTEFFVSQRPMLLASIEAFAQADRVPGLREQLARAYERARLALAAPLGLDAIGEGDEKTMRLVGSFHLALVSGLGLQWLLDPEGAPNGDEIAHAMRVFVNAVDHAGAAVEGAPTEGGVPAATTAD